MEHGVIQVGIKLEAPALLASFHGTEGGAYTTGEVIYSFSDVNPAGYSNNCPGETSPPAQ